MSFEKGKMNFSIISMASYDRDKVLGNLAGESYKGSEPGIDSPVTDITSGISLATMKKDEFEVDDLVFGGMPYFAVRKRELKIDSSTVKEILERRIYEAGKRGETVSSKAKRIMKEEIVSALEDGAQEKLSGTRAIIPASGSIILTEATSSSKIDDFIDHMYSFIEMNAFGVSGGLTPIGPDAMYETETGRDRNGYIPIRMNKFETSEGIGHDFLTYLLMSSEIEGFYEDGTQVSITGSIELSDCRDCSVGAKKTVLKEGTPSLASELISALESGKKVSSLDISICFGGDVYSVSVDNEFRFKKFSIKDEEKISGIHERIEMRILSVMSFLEGFKKVFRKFTSTEETNEKMIQIWLEKKSEIFTSN